MGTAVKRINWEHLWVKFNDQNGCTEDLIKAFDELPFKKKFVLQLKNIRNINAL
ncbi:MAG: DUF1919 domain-containing protein [Desulfitobacterium hafniense]|nr:DUF1919 domain-containing protein [Desulfitobacterium hafniense]